MIIVFFHVLYLIGKMVYKNYQNAKHKDTSEDEEKSCVPVIRNFPAERTTGNPPEDLDEDDDSGQKAPRFSPPVYIQRYAAVGQVLVDPRYQGKIKKVVDFGCSELGFFHYLKNIPGIEEILCVDVDRDTLERYKFKTIPLNADFLQNRQHSLTVRVCEGSVTHRDKILANSDAVVAIELIEHLYPDTLMDFPYNVFGFIKPLVVVVTTPNADFNVLFPNMSGAFRHWDHKFEWTRQQFEYWAKNIVSRYPEYEVRFEGVGAGPPGTEELGCCSQMAIFNRICSAEIESIVGTEGLLKIVDTQDYPYRVDNRSDEEKILDEASYHIRRFTQSNDECLEEYPMDSLMKNLENFFVTSETLREILTNGGWSVIDGPDGPVIQCPALSTFSDYEDEIYVDENEDSWADSGPQENENGFGTWRNENVEAEYQERWDDDDSMIPVVLVTSNEVDPASNRVDRIGDMERVEFSLSSETTDLDAIEVMNVCHVSSSIESVDRASTFAETSGWDVEIRGNSGFRVNTDSRTARKSNRELQDSSEFDKSLMTTESSVGSCSVTKFPQELASLCSIYLESSRNDERDSCPQNITDSSFDCTDLQRSFENSMENSAEYRGSKGLPDRARRSSLFNDPSSDDEPRYSSSPRTTIDLRKPEDKPGEFSQSASHCLSENSGNSSISTISSSESFRTVQKFFPSEIPNKTYRIDEVVRPKRTNECSELPGDKSSLASQGSIDEERNLCATRSERFKIPGSLSLRSSANSGETIQSVDVTRGTSTADKTIVASDRSENKRKKPRDGNIDDARIDVGDSRHQSGSSKTEESLRVVARKTGSPETPPNSWSPEIMDSGYPNSSSIQDTSPEYDLSSIAQDRISDLESPSLAEAPRPGFLERGEVENGDLANNNRDGEGNNVMAAGVFEDELEEDLQPLIDVLENDIENENDIYALENGFPVWLLRILGRGNAAGRRPVPRIRDPEGAPRVRAVGDAVVADPDEGFDSTSSENDESHQDEDDDDEDDDDDDEEISMGSYEANFGWKNSGDHC